MICKDIVEMIRKICPEEYAEGWDNVGLLVGDYDRKVKKILISLDATDEAVRFAVEKNADMIVTHHPLIFKPQKTILKNDIIGRRIIEMAKHDISYYAMHTNFDTCIMGNIVSERLGLNDIQPLDITGTKDEREVGIGSIGIIKENITFLELAKRVKERFDLGFVIRYGVNDSCVRKVAIVPGSGSSYVKKAIEQGADVLITGDVGHHTAIDAMAEGLSIIDAGHYGLEQIYLEYMKKFFDENINDTEIIIYDQGETGYMI